MLIGIISLLTVSERRRAVVLLVAALFMAVIEVAGIGGIAAFIAAVADPEVLARSRWLGEARRSLGLADTREFLIAAGVGLFVLLLVRNLLGLFVLWLRLHFLHGTRQAMTARLLSFYLSRPYDYFLRTNSATITKNIMVEVNTLITTCLFSWIMLISDIVMGLAVLALLVWHDPVLTAIATVGVGGLAASIPVFTHRKLQPLGAKYRQLTDGLFKTTNEAIGGIKEIKVLGRESFFARVFGDIAKDHARVTIRYMMLTDGPRFMFEVVVVGGILAAVLIALAGSADYAAFAGTVALFAAAAYRLMPLAHRMLSSIAGLQFNRAVLDALGEGLRPSSGVSLGAVPTPLPFRGRIRFRGVSFRYAGAAQETISGLSFEVPCNQSIAFVGSTGVGKTTVVDLMIGLLSPTGGKIEVDDVALGDETQRAWQANIGYVPQQVFLLDDTIRRNIAVGVPDREIDDEALAQAAQMAHVDAFVASLPGGYDTVIGERGIRLSGGQRQRIGIARALNRNPSGLILIKYHFQPET